MKLLIVLSIVALASASPIGLIPGIVRNAPDCDPPAPLLAPPQPLVYSWVPQIRTEVFQGPETIVQSTGAIYAQPPALPTPISSYFGGESWYQEPELSANALEQTPLIRAEPCLDEIRLPATPAPLPLAQREPCLDEVRLPATPLPLPLAQREPCLDETPAPAPLEVRPLPAAPAAFPLPLARKEPCLDDTPAPAPLPVERPLPANLPAAPAAFPLPLAQREPCLDAAPAAIPLPDPVRDDSDSEIINNATPSSQPCAITPFALNPCN